MAAIPAVLLGGVMLAACVGPGPAAASSLHDFLVDLHAHSVDYAYNQLTASAEQRTSYNPFFNAIMGSDASYRVVSNKVISSTEVNFRVQVMIPGQATHYVEVQMLEQGNAGDWLVGAPFSTQGARGIRTFAS